MTLAELVARYESMYGQAPARNAMEKLRAMHMMRPSCDCVYCGMALFGGADTEFDHKNAEGKELREANVSTRDEIKAIIAGRHKDMENRQFICNRCNKMKGSLKESEWLASPMYRYVSRNK